MASNSVPVYQRADSLDGDRMRAGTVHRLRRERSAVFRRHRTAARCQSGGGRLISGIGVVRRLPHPYAA